MIPFKKQNGVWGIPQQENWGLVRTYVPKIQCLLRLADIDIFEMCEQTKVELAVLDSEGLASTKEYGAEMSVGVHAGIVTGLVYVSAVLSVYRTWVAVLMLLSKVGDHLSHNIKKVVL